MNWDSRERAHELDLSRALTVMMFLLRALVNWDSLWRSCDGTLESSLLGLDSRERS